jgi:hypothetical protein
VSAAHHSAQERFVLRCARETRHKDTPAVDSRIVAASPQRPSRRGIKKKIASGIGDVIVHSAASSSACAAARWLRAAVGGNGVPRTPRIKEAHPKELLTRQEISFALGRDGAKSRDGDADECSNIVDS